MRRRPLLLRLAIASLVIGAFALVRNLISTFSTMQAYPSADVLAVFLSTQDASGGTSPMLVFAVWGPLLFGAIGVALLVAHRMTTRSGASQGSEQWQQPQQQWQEPQPWQPEQQGGQQPTGQQQPGQQQPGQQPNDTWQPNPVQPLGGQQPPPPNASDRIQP